jgi:hypothetical protein
MICAVEAIAPYAVLASVAWQSRLSLSRHCKPFFFCHCERSEAIAPFLFQSLRGGMPFADEAISPFSTQSLRAEGVAGGNLPLCRHCERSVAIAFNPFHFSFPFFAFILSLRA